MERSFLTSSSSFEDLVSGDYFYVDKSLFIRDIVEMKKGLFLFTRPRRFGKTTNLDMLDRFFNCRFDSRNLFDRLRISGTDCYEQHLNRYCVIRLNFANCDSPSHSAAYKRFSMMMSDAASGFRRIEHSPLLSSYERSLYRRMTDCEMDRAEFYSSVPLLCRWIENVYGKEVVILIDEYDKPVNSSVIHGYYRELTADLRPFLESALKNNTHYRFAVMTGVSRITKESIFSGLNNLNEFDIFNSRYDEYFGFNEDEVERLLDDTGLDAGLIDGIREYYDGYRFGDCDIYNPFSVMRCLEAAYYGKPGFEPHWVNSGDTQMIADALNRTSAEFRDEVLTLGIPSNRMRTRLNPYLDFRYLESPYEEDLEEAVLTLMVTSGYLKAIPAGDGEYDVMVPNTEVFMAFRLMATRMRVVNERRMSTFIRSIYGLDSARATSDLNRILDGMSPRDHYDEYIHKIVLSTLLGYSGFRYQNELGSGDGFIDIYVESDGGGCGLLIELKCTDDRKTDLEALSEKALEQIASKDYSRSIREPHIAVGIAFRGHTASVMIGHTVDRDSPDLSS